MSKARQLADLLDSNGDVVVGALDNAPDPDLTPYAELAGANFTGAITADADGATVATFDRATSDGTIVDLQKDGTSVGSIGVYDTGAGLDVYMADTVCGLRMSQAGTDNILPCNADGSNSDNDIDLGSSSTRFKDLYLSGGVYLGGTGSANYLDDYEEGAFDLDLYAGGSKFMDISCTYTKIGDRVFISGRRTNTNAGATGAVTVVGSLPFTPNQDSMLTVAGNFRSFSIQNQMHFTIVSGSTTLRTAQADAVNRTTGTNAWVRGGTQTASYMSIQGNYRTAS